LVVWIYIATANKRKPFTTTSVVLVCVCVCSLVCACLIKVQAINAHREYYSEMAQLITKVLIKNTLKNIFH
jgi:hypothetical protein